MISLDIIEQSILELEQRDTTFSNCERLAPLYIVRDHLLQYNKEEKQKIGVTGASNFVKAVNGKSMSAVLYIMDDLMKTVYALYPQIYDAVMDKIMDI